MIIEIQPTPVPVSYLSSLLRIIQAAVRETAFSSNHIDPSESNQPILLASLSEEDTKLLIDQGLANDNVRGNTTSSARRESPSQVFGISTPGPLDKTSGAPNFSNCIRFI
mgnify:CR=1 FL=1